MTTQEATHAPNGTDEETTPLEVESPLFLENATPLLLEDVLLPLSFEDTPLEGDAPLPFPLDEETTPLSLYDAPASPLLPAAPPEPEPARRVKASAPDPFAVGVRMLRMAPVWLLLTTLGCGMLVLLLGWMKTGGDASASVSPPPKQNDSRAVEAAPKADAAGPQTAAANSPEVAPASVPAAVPVQNDAPAQQQPAQAAAPAEQPAPAQKAPEQAQAEQPMQADDAGAKFTVQAGSHSDQSEANAQVSRLRAAGFEARSVAAELPGRGTWYRVQVGRFADRAEASKAAGQLRSKGAAAGAIVAPLQN